MIDVILGGIGGQGVQLCAKVLALALMEEGSDVHLSNYFDGAMRGGRTEATVVGGQGLGDIPGIVPSVSTACVLHNRYWDALVGRLRPSSLVLIETSMADVPIDPGHELVPVPAMDVAADLGNPMLAGMVMLGTYGGRTGAVTVDSLCSAMRAQLPAHRAAAADANEAALRRGAEVGAPVDREVTR